VLNRRGLGKGDSRGLGITKRLTYTGEKRIGTKLDKGGWKIALHSEWGNQLEKKKTQDHFEETSIRTSRPLWILRVLEGLLAGGAGRKSKDKAVVFREKEKEGKISKKRRKGGKADISCEFLSHLAKPERSTRTRCKRFLP